MNPVELHAAIPVIVLTGFLGAGKTSLLNDYLACPASSGTAVIVNEFGDIPIDNDLVRVGNAEIVSTTTGCLCCAPGADIRTTLFELMEARRARQVAPFDRVVIETTGLADPAPVINQLVHGALRSPSMEHIRVGRQFCLAGVICVVDTVVGPLTLERHFECMKQVAMADCVILSKGDMRDGGSRRDIDEQRAALRALNLSATILDRHDPNFDVALPFAPRPYAPEALGADVEGWLAMEQALAGTRHAAPSANRHADRGIRTAAFTIDTPLDPRTLDGFMSILRMAAGASLLRLKGIVCLSTEPERPVVIQAVQHCIHPPHRLQAWPGPDRRSRLVAVTCDIEARTLDAFFDALRPKPERNRNRAAIR